jgi:HD superfamily phosphohydrolase
VTLQGISLDLVGHPLVQRLWGIRQTGMAHLVFPGAGHSRLEHSLGTLWVSRVMAQALELPSPEAEVVEVAALLHDLGHPPFSHTLDGPLRECLGKPHEKVGIDLIQGVFPPGYESQGRGIDGFRAPPLPEVLERHGIRPKEVASLLASPPPRRRHYLGEMLHGSIDADRLDYLQRDAHYTGVAHGAIDANRILETLGREGSHIVFAEKGRAAVEGFLVARSLMYSAVYYNKTVRIAEMMLQSAVERLPNYPETVGPLFSATDFELFCHLQACPGHPLQMARRLRARQLYKRVATWPPDGPEAPPSRRIPLVSPSDRRRLEDTLSEALGGRPGEVLVDVVPPEGDPDDLPRPGPLDAVRVREGAGIVDLLRDAPIWRTLALRPPTPWRMAVYVAPRLRAVGERRAGRLLDRFCS